MAYGCDLTRVFTYEGSEKDSLINYTTLAITLITLVLCTQRASERASRYARCAAWFWVPFTVVLFALQVFADCSTDNVGISAVWSAYAGFIFLGWRRMQHLREPGFGFSSPSEREGEGGAPANQPCPSSLSPPSTSLAIVASLVVWLVVCIYYAIVEEAITTVAHLVAFGVGAAALLLFEALHQIPASINRGAGGTPGDSTPYDELRDK